nr:uncharacterized protein LOC129455632 [Misgurnus anguillicaudatus]
MSKYIFNVIILVGIASQCWICASIVDMIVQHEQNVTLSCNVNASSTLEWFHLRSEKMTLLIFAKRGNIKKKKFIIEHNEDASHYQLKEDNITKYVSLAIVRVGEPDTGLYYCSTRINGNGMHFGTPVRLTFTDAKLRGFSNAADNVDCSTRLICAYSACGLCGIICVCVLCYKQGSSGHSCISCLKANSNSKDAEVQYSSLRFVKQPRGAATTSANVTYATAANKSS